MASKPLDAAVYAYLVDNDFLDAAKALRTQLGVKGGELLFAAAALPPLETAYPARGRAPAAAASSSSDSDSSSDESLPRTSAAAMLPVGLKKAKKALA